MKLPQKVISESESYKIYQKLQIHMQEIRRNPLEIHEKSRESILKHPPPLPTCRLPSYAGRPSVRWEAGVALAQEVLEVGEQFKRNDSFLTIATLAQHAINYLNFFRNLTLTRVSRSWLNCVMLQAFCF